MRILTLLVLLGFVGCQKNAPAEHTDKSPEPTAATPAPTTPAVATPAPAPSLLATGASVPGIVSTAHDGSRVDFKAIAGKPFVVYFYPKDDTPG